MLELLERIFLLPPDVRRSAAKRFLCDLLQERPSAPIIHYGKRARRPRRLLGDVARTRVKQRA